MRVFGLKRQVKERLEMMIGILFHEIQVKNNQNFIIQ